MLRMLVVLSVCAALVGVASAGNWALEFDGSDDYVIMRNFSIEYEELTLEAWIQPLPGGTADIAYQIMGVPADLGDNVYFQFESNESTIMVDPATQECRLTGGHQFHDGQWYHVAAVYDPPDVDIYVLGGFVAHRNCTIGPIVTALTDLIIGKEIPESTDHQYWRGYLDEIRIWTVARTPEELAATMHVELTGSEPGLYGYWRFNEASGQVVHDSSQRGHDGYLGNSADPDSHDPVWVLVDAPVPVGGTTWSTIKALYR